MAWRQGQRYWEDLRARVLTAVEPVTGAGVEPLPPRTRWVNSPIGQRKRRLIRWVAVFVGVLVATMAVAVYLVLSR